MSISSSLLILLCSAVLAVAVPTARDDDAVGLAKRETDVQERGWLPEPFFYNGHDLSSLKLLEDGGAIYKDTARRNQTRPAEDILGDGGMNSVRLRIWVNPPPESYGLDYTIALARRFSAKGYRIYLDFHFSDTWADPGHQTPPAAWPTTLQPLAATLRKYVSQTLVAFHKAGVNLAIVSLGNEIRHGMLWPLGYLDVDTEPWNALVEQFQDFATLWKAAREGVDDALWQGVPKPDVMIHIDDGWNQTLQERWFGALVDTGKVSTADWDVFGFSFYPFYGTAATYSNLAQTLDALAHQYNKPLHVAETDWPELCNGEYEPIPALSEPEIPVSVQGQIEWVQGILKVVKMFRSD